jgi:GNAT superfamily N-acetyltransferase
MQIRPFRSTDSLLMKAVRLRSLKDAPYAFGGLETYDEESKLSDADWQQAAAEAAGEVPKWKGRCITYVLLDGSEPCGTASCYLCPRVPKRAYFSAAWIDPRYRRQGYGRQFMNLAIAWATAHGANHLKLWVDGTNPHAAAFYKSLGFTPTGETHPVSPECKNGESSYELRLTSE